MVVVAASYTSLHSRANEREQRRTALLNVHTLFSATSYVKTSKHYNFVSVWFRGFRLLFTVYRWNSYCIKTYVLSITSFVTHGLTHHVTQWYSTWCHSSGTVHASFLELEEYCSIKNAMWHSASVLSLLRPCSSWVAESFLRFCFWENDFEMNHFLVREGFFFLVKVVVQKSSHGEGKQKSKEISNKMNFWQENVKGADRSAKSLQSKHRYRTCMDLSASNFSVFHSNWLRFCCSYLYFLLHVKMLFDPFYA